MDAISAVLGQISSFVWGPVMLVLLLGTGLYLSIGLRFMTLRRIGRGFALAMEGRKAGAGEEGNITPFQALATALSATIGTGNIAGVATAIALGGPGAVFWMWITALVGMATKYAEAVLAVQYRKEKEDLEDPAKKRFVGGPMYYLRDGVGGRLGLILGGAFATFAMIAGFGIGNAVQSGEVANAISTVSGSAWLDANRWAIGIGISLLVFAVIIGGLKRIAFVAERLVPLMAALYVTGALIILLFNADGIPGALALIVTDAFTGSAAAGGFAGAAVWAAIRFGVARGIFSNEAGLGSAPIAHAAAKTNDPVRQGTVAMMGTFIDTIIVCTMTALVILSVQLPSDQRMIELKQTATPTGETQLVCLSADERTVIAEARANGNPLPTGMVLEQVNVDYAWQSCRSGAALSLTAFAAGIPAGDIIVTLGLMVFAFTTILGWSYYGERSAEYLFGARIILPFRILWSAMPFIATLVALDIVWTISDIMNAMMALPNLIGLLLLSGVVFTLTRQRLAKE